MAENAVTKKLEECIMDNIDAKADIKDIAQLTKAAAEYQKVLNEEQSDTASFEIETKKNEIEAVKAETEKNAGSTARYVTDKVVDILKIGVPAAATIFLTLTGFKFEETGSILTTTMKSLYKPGSGLRG